MSKKAEALIKICKNVLDFEIEKAYNDEYVFTTDSPELLAGVLLGVSHVNGLIPEVNWDEILGEVTIRWEP